MPVNPDDSKTTTNEDGNRLSTCNLFSMPTVPHPPPHPLGPLGSSPETSMETRSYS